MPVEFEFHFAKIKDQDTYSKAIALMDAGLMLPFAPQAVEHFATENVALKSISLVNDPIKGQRKK
jgi:hypothetical protein